VQAEQFKIISLLLYSSIYIIAGLLLTLYTFKTKFASGLFVFAGLLTILFSLTEGLNIIGDIRRYYITEHKGSALWMLGIRYFLFAGVGMLLYLINIEKSEPFILPMLQKYFLPFLM